jgi:hypothetical protein
MQANRAVQPRLGDALFRRLSRSAAVLADYKNRYLLVYNLYRSGFIGIGFGDIGQKNTTSKN